VAMNRVSPRHDIMTKFSFRSLVKCKSIWHNLKSICPRPAKTWVLLRVDTQMCIDCIHTQGTTRASLTWYWTTGPVYNIYIHMCWKLRKKQGFNGYLHETSKFGRMTYIKFVGHQKLKLVSFCRPTKFVSADLILYKILLRVNSPLPIGSDISTPTSTTSPL
jgi:hypothetical protein